MSKHMDRILAQGVIAGVLEPTEDAPSHAARPWPLTLFTGIGAWFAAIPFAVILFLLGDERTLSLSIIGVTVLCGTVAVLRERPPLFMEQFALAGMVAGALVLFIGIAKNTNSTTSALVLFVAFAIAAAVVPQTWLRVLLGATMGISGVFSLFGFVTRVTMQEDMQLCAVLGVSAGWCLLSGLSSQASLSMHVRAGVEAVSQGMSAALICSPFWLTHSFLIFEVNGWLNRFTFNLPNTMSLEVVVSATVTLGASIYLAIKWAQLRSLWFCMIAIVLTVFTCCIPSLSVLVLIGAVSLVSGRRSTAILCAAMLVWWIFCMYFSLQFSLILKSLLLAVTGALLALTAALLIPAESTNPDLPGVLPRPKQLGPTEPKRTHASAILGCAVLSLVIANVAIFRAEAVARTGKTLFVELAPVDPRSLMQGDYMRLTFGMGELQVTGSAGKPVALVGSVDDRLVWTAQRIDDGGQLAKGEIKINLSSTSGPPILVTDAWFFKEGEGQRWQNARFGELRVKPDGSAILITLRGPKLEAL